MPSVLRSLRKTRRGFKREVPKSDSRCHLVRRCREGKVTGDTWSHLEPVIREYESSNRVNGIGRIPSYCFFRSTQISEIVRAVYRVWKHLFYFKLTPLTPNAVVLYLTPLLKA